MDETVVVVYTGNWSAPVRFVINGHEYFFCADDEHRMQRVPIADAERLVELEGFGYAKLVEPETAPESSSEEVSYPMIGEIYAMCDAAGVKPGDLRIHGEHPTLAEVQTAIAGAQSAAPAESIEPQEPEE